MNVVDPQTSSAKAVNLALVGYGRWGTVYKKEIDNLKPAGLNLKIICSQQQGLRFPEIEIINHWSDLGRFADVQGVIIATPPHTHLEIASYALRHGKTVLIEKPICTDGDQLARFAQEFKPTDLESKVMVNHIHLYNPRFLRLLEALPLVGPIQAIESKGGAWGPFRATYSSLWDYAPHDLSMVLKVLGCTPLSVSIKLLKEQLIREVPNQEIGRNYSLHLTFPSAIEVAIEVGSLYPQKVRSFRVIGKRGVLELDDTRLVDPLLFNNKPLQDVEPRTPLQGALLRFADLVRGEVASVDPDNSGIRMALQVTKILSAVEKSS